jgi:hypothetical protein
MKFAIKVGVSCREPGNRLGDERVFLGPVIASARQDLRYARVEPGVHPVSVD